jgi:hypothetical protein
MKHETWRQVRKDHLKQLWDDLEVVLGEDIDGVAICFVNTEDATGVMGIRRCDDGHYHPADPELTLDLVAHAVQDIAGVPGKDDDVAL